MAAVDVNAVLTSLLGSVGAVASVGLAVVLVFVALRSFKWFQALLYISPAEAAALKPIPRTGRVGKTPFGYGDAKPTPAPRPATRDDGPDLLGVALGASWAASAASAASTPEPSPEAPSTGSGVGFSSGGGGDFGGGGASGDY